MEIVAVDIGGTRARFTLASLEGGQISLGQETVLNTSDYSGIAEAWRAYAELLHRDLPRSAAIAIAAPIYGETVRMTNNKWVLRPSDLPIELGLDRLVFLNDFAAVAHGVSSCARDELVHIAGPDEPLPEAGVVTVIGPGTGLGVAILRRSPAGDLVIATEGSHVTFAPLDPIEEAIVGRLKARHGRVSIERVVSGVGLCEIHAVLTGEELDDREIWSRALSGGDPEAAASLDRFCAILGSVAGDFALAHGADAVVVAGGLGQRLAVQLRTSGFAERFPAKGRYQSFMSRLPVKLITHPQPGLLGAAAAFAAEYGG